MDNRPRGSYHFLGMLQSRLKPNIPRKLIFCCYSPPSFRPRTVPLLKSTYAAPNEAARNIAVSLYTPLTMEQNQQPAGSLSWRLSSHPITLLCFLTFRICERTLSDFQESCSHWGEPNN